VDRFIETLDNKSINFNKIISIRYRCLEERFFDKIEIFEWSDDENRTDLGYHLVTSILKINEKCIMWGYIQDILTFFIRKVDSDDNLNRLIYRYEQE
jgi:hypothetical protein